MGSREFVNEFPEYKGEKLLETDGTLEKGYKQRLLAEVERQLNRLTTGLQDTDDRDYSVYTGITGIAYLHYHLWNVVDGRQSTSHLHAALQHTERALRHLKGRKLSFLCGDAGPLALGAVLYEHAGKRDKSRDCVKRLVSLHKDVCRDPEIPDEILFGRAGYLFALLFVQRNIDHSEIDTVVIERVIKAIIDSGRSLSSEERSPCPLMYAWHGKQYLGAAHGMVGIFYILMQVTSPDIRHYLEEFLRPSIDYLMTLQFPSGNYPSSIGSATGDKLIHWCHGAPGWIHMFILAYKVFNDKKYMSAAKSCSEVIWQRGLLRKGYGICHGVAGNAYGFLALYQATQDVKHLHRAIKFAEWCFDYGKHGCRTPDRPLSLFEGLAGTIYFLADLTNPQKAKFPAFQL
ncbi:lanC-like protein 2 [Lingula anatina]|uniref:LanC-like protein 2 n=1 Tax=Lingula anatina TaxID=7574 RepID=A0A1S3JGZ2_LINAN|nr:lanC-like protein 2 [Lingula anatina]|eukprot:XP_013409667.1 lanC-like protein 2 [Lingula anatina]